MTIRDEQFLRAMKIKPCVIPEPIRKEAPSWREYEELDASRGTWKFWFFVLLILLLVKAAMEAFSL